MSKKNNKNARKWLAKQAYTIKALTLLYMNLQL